METRDRQLTTCSNVILSVETSIPLRALAVTTVINEHSIGGAADRDIAGGEKKISPALAALRALESVGRKSLERAEQRGRAKGVAGARWR